MNPNRNSDIAAAASSPTIVSRAAGLSAGRRRPPETEAEPVPSRAPARAAGVGAVDTGRDEV